MQHQRVAVSEWRETKPDLQSLFDTIDDFLFILDEEGFILRVNPAVEWRLGRSAQELCGTHFLDVHPAGRCDKPATVFSNTLQKETGPFPMPLLAKDGSLIPVEMRVTLGTWDGHRVLFGIARDITQRTRAEAALQLAHDELELRVRERTSELVQANHTLQEEVNERKRVEAALREAEEKYRTLAQHASDAIVVVQEDKPVYSNPACEEMLGYTLAEMAGSSFLEVIAPEDQVRIRKYYARRKKGGGVPEQFIVDVLSRDGRRLTMEVKSSWIEYQGKQAAMAVMRDVTKRTQREREQERLIEELEAFAHTVAHDIKSPLARIIGYCELIEYSRDALGEDGLSNSLNVISRNARKMSNITDEMLLLAGVRTLTEVPLAPLDMTGVVTEALNRLTDLIAECQAEVHVPDEWPVASGYAPWVEEVWVNYISNAVKFGGSPPLVELGATPEADGGVRFWVRDNGPGLTEEEQTRLFRPFTRLEQVRAKGYGLGLSIARRIVEKLDGQIGVESQPGQGSVFSFTLPAPRKESAATCWMENAGRF